MTPSNDIIVVASICGPVAATTGVAGGGGGGAALLPQKDMAGVFDSGVHAGQFVRGQMFRGISRLDRTTASEAQKKLV